MATIKTTKTIVAKSELQRVVYGRKSFLIFNWWEQVRIDSIESDLFIKTEEKYKHIYLNGKKLK